MRSPWVVGSAADLRYHCSLGKLGEIDVFTAGDRFYVKVLDAIRNLRFTACHDDQGYLRFAEGPKDAPIINCATLTVLPWHRLVPAPRLRDRELLRILLAAGAHDRMTYVYVNIGTEGLGAGTCAVIGNRDFPKDKHPVAEIEFPSKGNPLKPVRVILKER